MQPLNDDDDDNFVVHVAGPVLPIRRPRPLKCIAGRNVPLTQYESQNNYCQSKDYLYDHKKFNPHAPIPTEGFVPLHAPSKMSYIPILNPTRSTSTEHQVQTKNLSKTVETQTINHGENLVPKSPFRSRSTTPTLQLQKSRPPTPPINVESKVKLYIEKVKKFDNDNRALLKKTKSKPLVLSLEDLYQIPSTSEEVKSDASHMEIKLRETLRIIKEKDEVINKLRESCHDLKLKCADAENRIDEMRFGYGLDKASVIEKDINRRRSSFTLGRCFDHGDFVNDGMKQKHSQSVSDIHSSHSPPIAKKEMKDQATETDRSKDKRIILKKTKSQSQLTTTTCTTDAAYLDDDLDSAEIDIESGDTNFDPVLEEKCSNWLEKVQNWKTDPSHKLNVDLKDKDSCGDRDSGFRGSAELEGHYQKVYRSTSRSKPKPIRKPLFDDTEPEPLPESTQTSKSPTPPTDEEQFAYRSHPSTHQHFNPPHESLTLTEDTGPPSLQIAQPWMTFSGHLNPFSSTDYVGFPSHSSSQSREPYFGSLENSRQRKYRNYGQTNSSTTSLDHRELLKNFEKRLEVLQPLLDNTTSVALRVKRKSENLAQIVHDVNTRQEFHTAQLQKDRRSFS